MAAEGITLRVESDLAALDAILRRADDPSPIMAAIAGFMVMRAQRHIETETGPGGAKWPALAPSTQRRKVRGRRRGSANMLRVTGRLYSSVTGDSGPSFAEIGTNVIYAAIQQLGGEIQREARNQVVNLSTGKGRRFVKASAKRKEVRTVSVGAYTIRIPARPFLYLDEPDIAAILDIAADGLRGEAAR